MIERIGRLRRSPGHGGFTLIELLVVIVILGILAGVVVFSVGGVTDKGESAAFQTDARTLRTAEEAYYAKFGEYADVQTLADAGFLAGGVYAGNRTEKGNTVELGPGADGKPNGSYTITCGTNGETPPGDCGGAGTIARGGTLVVGETFASNATTNVASSTAGGTHAWWETMYNGLIELDEAGNPSPELASAVPTVGNGGIADNGATYTLTLRQDVEWHDSTATTPHYFNAEDVKFTFEKVLLQFHARTRGMAALLGYNSTTCRTNNITATNGPGGNGGTVVFSFASPYIPFLKQLNVTEAAMNPANAIPGISVGVDGCPTLAQAGAVKVGTGPFRFDSINTPSAGDGRVVRNARYWKAGLPYLDAILMRPYTNEAARYNALVNGDVDFVWDVPNPSVAALEANASFRVAATQSLGGGPNSVDQVIFNLKASGSTVASVANGTAPDHPILGNVNVRRAVFHAINRDDYLNIGRNGIGTVSRSPISSQIFGAANDIALPGYDPGAANTLLDGAGWNGPRVTANGTPNVRTAQGHPTLPDGTPLTIRFLQGSGIFTDRLAVIKANLAAVGIDMPLTQNFASSGTTATVQVFTNRDFDLYIVNYANGYDPHVGVRRQYHSDQISTVGTPNNAAGYRNPLVDADFDQAVQTLDPTARYALYHDFQERVANDLPYAWMIETPNVRGFTAGCTGFKVWTGLFAESASCAG